jgi:hypothetical protein
MGINDPPTHEAISAQILGDLLQRGIKPLAKNNAVAILLDERVFPEIVLVDRTRSRLMDAVAELACTRPQGTFVRHAPDGFDGLFSSGQEASSIAAYRAPKSLNHPRRKHAFILGVGDRGTIA